MSKERIEAQARLIAALAETMTDDMWASEILNRCAQMREAIAKIERTAESRRGGER